MTVNSKICALPECGKPLNTTPYAIAGKHELYCTRACMEKAFEDLVKPAGKSRGKPPVEKPATEFGDAGVVRRFCDRKGCGKPITLEWSGRQGKYCSNDCLKLSEKSGESKMSNIDDDEIEETDEAEETDEETEEVEEEEEEPVKVGKKVAKKPAKVAKKVAAKASKKVAAAPSKKVAGKNGNGKKVAAKDSSNGNGSGRHLAYPRNYIIHRTATFKDCPSLKGNGVSAKRVKMIKEGQTVEEYLESLRHTEGVPAGLGNLQSCEKQGYVKISPK